MGKDPEDRRAMGHRYRITERAGLRLIGTVLGLAGPFFAVIGLGVVLSALGRGSVDPGRAQLVGGLTAALIGSGMAVVGWDHLVRRPWLLEIGENGTVAIHRAVRSVQLPATAIVALERRERLLGIEDEDGRVLTLLHAGGAVPIAYFPEVEAFIGDIQGLNPYVEVRGQW